MVKVGIDNSYLKIKRTQNWSQKKERDAIYSKSYGILSDLRAGLEHISLDKQDLKNIVYGIVRTAYDGHNVMSTQSK